MQSWNKLLQVPGFLHIDVERLRNRLGETAVKICSYSSLFFFFSNMRRPIRSVGQKQSQHRGLAWEHWVPSHLYYLTPSPCKSISSNENWYALPGGSCKTNPLSVPHLTQLTANPRFICRIAHAAIEWEGLRNCHQDLEYSVILAVFPLSLSASCVLFLFAFILSAYFVFLVWWTWP